MIPKKTYEELKEWLEGKKFQKRIDSLAKKHKGKKVLLYGAGILASVIADNYNLEGLDIIGVADKRFIGGEGTFHNFKEVDVSSIADCKFDVILLATYNSYDVKAFLKEHVLPELKKVAIEPFVAKNFKEKFSEFLTKMYNSL